jgi:formylglycine-generating enzyme required for sulfatase activity
LPTDAEWTAAVGEDLYPWGGQWPPAEGVANYAGSETADDDWPGSAGTIAGYRDGYARTSPVGSFRPNRYGLYDMGGNVWQWCEDWYRTEMNSEEIRKDTPILDDDGGGQRYRVLRGAAWDDRTITLARSAARNRRPANARGVGQGFRCVLETGGSAP